MVKITNGTRTTMVTKGAFRELYEPMGWIIADLSNEKVQSEDLPEEEEKSPENAREERETVPEEEIEPEEVEIPLSEMKLADLKAFAAAHDIDISAAKNKQDIRAIIKAEMEE